jgi:serine/threonine-protein kinase
MANRDSLVGKVIAQRYRIDNARTDGSGTSMVFDATDLRRREQVVIRMVLAESLIDLDNEIATVTDALEHFMRQTQQLAALNHPSLVSVDDWGTQSIDGDVYTFTVLEYFAGGTLREILDRGRRLSPSQALVVGLDVCRALHFVHLRGWAHGDVRPANLFIGSDLRVRLGGLGIKRVVVAGQLSLEQARYAAPEIGLGEVPTERSDVYSLAMTLLESITGYLPFVAESAALTLAARVGKLLPVSANLGPIAAPIERAGRPNAAERFSALEFGQALAQIADKLPMPLPIEAVAARTFEQVIAKQEADNTAELLRLEVERAAVLAGVSVLGGDTGARGGTGTSGEDPLALGEPIRSRGRARLWILLAVVALAVSGVVAYQLIVNPTHVVPDVVGMSEGEARNSVGAYNWTIVVAAERSDDIPQGNVVRTDPAAGTKLEEGQDFTIFISEGPTLSPLPDVVGLSVQDATDQLTALGLTVTTTQAGSEDVATDFVISWIVPDQPALVTGDKVLKGTSVELSVSTGPALREVPLIVGMTLEQATGLANDLRLVLVAGEPALTNATAKDLIGAQAPVPGTQVARDSTLVYSISLGPDLVKLPNIVGNSYPTVEKRLTEAGFVVGKVTGKKAFRMLSASSNGVRVNNGDMVPRGAVIDLTFP